MHCTLYNRLKSWKSAGFESWAELHHLARRPPLIGSSPKIVFPISDILKEKPNPSIKWTESARQRYFEHVHVWNDESYTSQLHQICFEQGQHIYFPAEQDQTFGIVHSKTLRQQRKLWPSYLLDVQSGSVYSDSAHSRSNDALLQNGCQVKHLKIILTPERHWCAWRTEKLVFWYLQEL